MLCILGALHTKCPVAMKTNLAIELAKTNPTLRAHLLAKTTTDLQFNAMFLATKGSNNLPTVWEHGEEANDAYDEEKVSPSPTNLRSTILEHIFTDTNLKGNFLERTKNNSMFREERLDKLYATIAKILNNENKLLLRKIKNALNNLRHKIYTEELFFEKYCPLPPPAKPRVRL